MGVDDQKLHILLQWPYMGVLMFDISVDLQNVIHVLVKTNCIVKSAELWVYLCQLLLVI